MSKILLTVVLWLPGTPEPQTWEVISIPFASLEECQQTGMAWSDETFKLIKEYTNDAITQDEVALTYCSSDGKLSGGKFEGQTHLL